MNFFFDNMIPKLAKMVELFTADEHRVSHLRYDERFHHSLDDLGRM
jgi:hypothetical protein